VRGTRGVDLASIGDNPGITGRSILDTIGPMGATATVIVIVSPRNFSQRWQRAHSG
jgi:hypothetical protein